MTFASLFTGGALVDVGAKAAGLTPLWGVELDPRIAEVARANVGHMVRCMNVLDADPHAFERVGVLHASPPCQNHSVAKTDGAETEQDVALALKTAEFVRVLLPRVFTLENVPAYRHSRSWGLIAATLGECGYFWDARTVNAADMGVPQTRRRMIVRAVRGGMVPELPAPLPWVGWYAAIEDLLPELPESRFAPWQLERLSANAKTFLLMIGATSSHPESGKPRCIEPGDPANTVATNSVRNARAFLVRDDNTQQQWGKGYRSAPEPSMSVSGSTSARAFLVHGTSTLDVRGAPDPSAAVVATVHSKAAVPKAWLDRGRVVKLTPRCLARFQSVPDSYLLPDGNGLACKIIGNGVPPKLYEAVVGSLL